jgi:7,8-dihydro-6-hydroxymethylpterin-pyrophosphokinase
LEDLDIWIDEALKRTSSNVQDQRMSDILSNPPAAFTEGAVNNNNVVTLDSTLHPTEM